jgi:hypothetical protein
MGVSYADWFSAITAVMLAVGGFWMRRLYADVDSARAEIQRLREEVANRMTEMVDKRTFDKHIDNEKLVAQDTRTELRSEMRDVSSKLDGLSALLMRVQIQIAGLRGPQQRDEA